MLLKIKNGYEKVTGKKYEKKGQGGYCLKRTRYGGRPR